MRKSLGKFKMKGYSDKGNITRHYIEIFDNGIVAVNQFILSKEPELLGFEKITTRFGKTLHRSVIAFKYGTISAIFETLNKTLIENNIKSKNIL